MSGFSRATKGSTKSPAWPTPTFSVSSRFLSPSAILVSHLPNRIPSSFRKAWRRSFSPMRTPSAKFWISRTVATSRASIVCPPSWRTSRPPSRILSRSTVSSQASGLVITLPLGQSGSRPDRHTASFRNHARCALMGTVRASLRPPQWNSHFNIGVSVQICDRAQIRDGNPSLARETPRVVPGRKPLANLCGVLWMPSRRRPNGNPPGMFARS